MKLCSLALIRLSVLALCFLAPSLSAQKDCNQTSVGFLPLIDMGANTYQGFSGGLYPNQSNAIPTAHLNAGITIAQSLQALDSNGQPDANGKLVLLSIGMSNTTQEFSTWVPMSDADANRAGIVRVVDGAQGGQHAGRIADPNAAYWTAVSQRLADAGVTEQQVQVVWMKEAVSTPTDPFPAHAVELQGLLQTICQILKQKFPNLQMCYLSSRIYAGYAGTALNPEPYAYESGFSVKWLIEQQINGDAALNFDATQGPVLAPWLAWGPYMWADGLTPRSDGLIWECDDFQDDGTHPATPARQKVADMLGLHFTTHATTVDWYIGPGGGLSPAVIPYGEGCPGSLATPDYRTDTLPFLGNPNFAFGVTDGLPNSTAFLFLGLSAASIPVDGCTLLVNPQPLFLIQSLPTNALGRAIAHFVIPNNPNLIGFSVYAQWMVLDPAAPNLQIHGGASTTRGAQVRGGT